VVEGVKEQEGFNHKLEYGNLWHAAEEEFSKCPVTDKAGTPLWEKAVWDYANKLRAQHPTADVDKWATLVCLQFPLYVKRWKSDPIERKRQPIWEEKTFCVPYRLPSGAVVKLRGKWDCVFANGKSIYLQENKTKGEIDETGITRTVHENLQTMFYQVALREWKAKAYDASDSLHYSDSLGNQMLPKSNLPNMEALTGRKIAGTLYNVVRRPLSNRFAPRQKKGESDRDFYKRVADQIAKQPDHWFKRWDITITDADVEAFRKRVFDPILEQLGVWWTSIEEDPFNPWIIDRPPVPWDGEHNYIPNPFHWQSPWGVYNSLASGWRGDYFDLLTSGSTVGLVKVQTLYPEL